MKLSLKDATFIIHFKPDIPERLENLKCVLNFYKKHTTDSQFFVVHEHSYLTKDEDKYINYIELELGRVMTSDDKLLDLVTYDDDPRIYHRTTAFNTAATLSNRPVVILADTDCIVHYKNVLEAVNNVMEPGRGMTVVHNGVFLEYKDHVKKEFISRGYDINYLTQIAFPAHDMKMLEHTSDFQLAHKSSKGGMIAVSQEYYKVCPECEFFVSWGFEDDFRVYVADRLGFKVGRIASKDAYFHHLPHPKSVRSEHRYYRNNQALYNFVRTLTDSQLEGFIKTFKR